MLQIKGSQDGRFCEADAIRYQVAQLCAPMSLRRERVGPFHGEACFSDLWWVCWSDAGELRSHVIDEVQVAVRMIVVVRIGGAETRLENRGTTRWKEGAERTEQACSPTLWLPPD